MSGVFIKFSAPKSASASAANIRYITRESATGAAESALYLHNLEHVQGADYRETRTNAISYSQMRLDEEQARSRNNPRESRTHYRAILSFDRAESSEQARELAKEWLEKNFKDARAVVAIHQDKKHHSHAHVWVDARDQNERKLQLNNRQFKNLDKSWAQIYARRYGEHYLIEHLNKKKETKNYKAEYRKAKAEGRAVPPAPERQRQNKIQNSKDQERGNYGFTKQDGLGDDQRAVAVRPNASRRREQDISRAVSAEHRASREANETLRGIKEARFSVERTRGASERGDAAVGQGKRDLSQSVRAIEETRQKLDDLGRELERGIERGAEREGRG